MVRWFMAAFVFAIVGQSALAQTAVDGDTIKLDGTTYRLWGIDAPETRQTCTSGWPAGMEATDLLRALMRDKTVMCEPKTTDRYGRTVAICRADGRDLGADMVSAGYALAFVRYSLDYIDLEAIAKMAKAGMHAYDCEKPWEWRARLRSGSAEVK